MFEMWLTYFFLFLSLYFEVFMLVAFLERRGASSAPGRSAGVLPSVAIVVPCYNEEHTLASTIESLHALKYPADKLEILIVDDGSTDATLAMAQQFSGDSRVRVFHKANGGKHTAMNYALARTHADLIGCLDADSVVAPDALLHIAPVFDNPAVAATTPGILVKKPETLLQYMQEAEYRFSIFSRFTLAALGSAFITPGPFSIFRTSFVREAGGWKHGHSTEDLEMALRIQDKGHLIANVPGAIIYTGTPRTLRRLFRQRVRWTYGFLRNAIDYRHMFGKKNYGNLGILILPMGVISIFIALYFFTRILYYAILALMQEILRIQVVGWQFHPGIDLSYQLYLHTTMLWFLIYASIALVMALICIGSGIGTGRRTLPPGTPLFVLVYCFLVPVWLGTAVVRAVFKTGVRWK